MTVFLDVLSTSSHEEFMGSLYMLPRLDMNGTVEASCDGYGYGGRCTRKVEEEEDVSSLSSGGQICITFSYTTKVSKEQKKCFQRCEKNVRCFK